MSLVVPGLLFLVFAAGDSYAAWYMLAFLPAVTVSLIRYFTLRYDLTPEHVVVREGLIFRSVRHIPYARIQNIDTKQNPLHRLCRVAEVRLETAGGREPEAVFRVLSLSSLEVIRAGVFARRGATSPGAQGGAAADADGDLELSRPFFRMAWSDIVIFGLLSQKGMALLAGLAYLMWEFELWARLKRALPFDPEVVSKSVSISGWIWAGLILFAMLQVITVVWAFLMLHGFRIVRSHDGLSTYCGLWIKQSATLPRHRIHFLSVREGLVSRWLGRVSIQAVSAGGDLLKEEQVSRKWLIPVMSAGRLDAILSEVQPELDLNNVHWIGIHPGAYGRMLRLWLIQTLVPCAALAFQFPLVAASVYVLLVPLGVWRAAVRSKRLGYNVGAQLILVRDGILTRERNAVRFSKIQSISIKQSPFDRRKAMSTLEIDTAGQNSSGLRLRIPYLAEDVAEALKDRLSALAGGTSFRW